MRSLGFLEAPVARHGAGVLLQHGAGPHHHGVAPAARRAESCPSGAESPPSAESSPGAESAPSKAVAETGTAGVTAASAASESHPSSSSKAQSAAVSASGRAAAASHHSCREEQKARGYLWCHHNAVEHRSQPTAVPWERGMVLTDADGALTLSRHPARKRDGVSAPSERSSSVKPGLVPQTTDINNSSYRTVGSRQHR